MELTKETLLDIVYSANGTIRKDNFPEENNCIQRLADAAYCFYCMEYLRELIEEHDKKEPFWIDASKNMPTPQQTESFFRSRQVLIKDKHDIRTGTLMLSRGKDGTSQTFWTDDELFTVHGVTHWAEI